MANTYTQIHIHAIFAVEGRRSLLPAEHLPEIHRIMTGMTQDRNHKMLAIGGMPDHLHIFFGLDPQMAISDFIRELKAASSKEINRRGWTRGRFNWQEGYGAFSYARSQVRSVCHYVRNQQQHHRRRTFREEYLDLLQRFEIEYDDQYVFNWID